MDGQIIILIVIGCLVSFLAGALVNTLCNIPSAYAKAVKRAEEVKAACGGKPMEDHLTWDEAVDFLAGFRDIKSIWQMINGDSSLEFNPEMVPTGWGYVWMGKKSYFRPENFNAWGDIKLSDVLTRIEENKPAVGRGLYEHITDDIIHLNRVDTLETLKTVLTHKYEKEQKMKLVNAGITNLTQLQAAIDKGTTLYLHSERIKIKLGVVQLPLCELQESLTCIQMEEVYDWTDHLGEGKLCKTIANGSYFKYFIMVKVDGKLRIVKSNGSLHSTEYDISAYAPVSSEEASMLCIQEQ